MTLYEGMFLLDNDVVRAGWDQAKAVVTDTLAKHGGTVRTARRWAERKLAYTIKKRNRATYLLVYFDGATETVSETTKELDLRDEVLRYLVLQVAVVPEGEEALAQAEGAADFAVPEPPPDDMPEELPPLGQSEEEDRPRRSDRPDRRSESETKSEEPKAEEAKSEEGGDKPAAETAEAATDTEKVAVTPTESTEG